MDLVKKVIKSRYKIIEKLADGNMSSVYLAHDLQNNSTLALKIVKISMPAQRSDVLIRFYTEIEAISAIDHPNIIKILDHGSFETEDTFAGLYIAFAYSDWQPLSDLLHKKSPLPFKRALGIIIKICNALEAVHKTGIIHGDIKPSNIILNIDSPENWLKVIDFGLARLKKYNYDGVAGTFLYMPPEQAGLLRLPVDERSDLYSLGVLFYQLLTGELPFFSESLIALLHEQLSQLPLPPSKIVNTIPGIIDSIVLKLLDKEPGNRYQSAEGLKYDLEKVLSGNNVFGPGEYDIPDRISANTSFIGREDELKKLFDVCENETGEIVCISGEGGIGKSRIVEKFCQYALSRDITHLEGKCYNRSNSIPYAPLHDILSSYAQHYFRYSKKNQEKISKIFKKNIGDLGNIIIKFNPLLRSILGEFPEPVSLDPETEKRRFYLVINKFLRSIAEAEGMLIITLEDIHWADAGTMDLLLEIAGSIYSSPVKILLTYRPEELKQKKEIYSLVERLFEYVLPDSEIKLQSFDEKEIGSIIPKFIQNTAEREKLAEYVYRKSHGNPLFAGEIIKYLISKEVFIKNDSIWRIDIERLSALKIPESVVEIILNRISNLKTIEIDILSHAAVIGKKFNYAVLAELIAKNITGKIDEDEIILTIDKALNQQIVERGNISSDEFVFIHDKIHDAFYHRIKASTKTKYHLSVARIIEARAGQDYDKYIFDLAYHYISGKNNDKILQYALPAAHIAREQYAYNEAIKYYEIVKDIVKKNLENNSDDSILGTWMECIEGLGISYAQGGRTDDAIELFEELIKHITLPVKKANIYREMSRASFRKGDLSRSEYYVQIGLSILNEKLPSGKRNVLLQTIRELIIFMISPLLPLHLFYRHIPGYSNKVTAIITLYEWLNWVYFFGESWKSLRTVFRMLNISRRNGKDSFETALSCYYYGFFCVSMGWFKKAEKYFTKSFNLMQKYGNIHGMAQCLGGWAFYYIMRGDFKSSIKSSGKSIELLKNIGDFVEISKSGQFLLNSYFLQSDYSTAQLLYNKYHKYLNNIFEEMTYSSFAFPILYYIETGEYQTAKDILDKYIPHQEKLKTWFLYYTYLALYGYCLCEEGKIEESLNYFEKAETVYRVNHFPSHTHILYPHYAEVMISDYLNRSTSITIKEQKKYLSKIRKTCAKAVRHTKSWNHSYDVSLRATAKCYTIINKPGKAEYYFKLSLSHSKKINRRYEYARTLYDYAVFLKNMERNDEAKDTFLSSYKIFDELGINKFRESILKILDLQSDSKDAFREDIKAEKTQYTIRKSQELLQIQELNDTMHEALSVAMTITGASGSHLFLYNEDKERLFPVMSRVLVEGKEHDYSMTVVEKVFSTGQAVLTSSAMEDENLLNCKSVITKKLKSILCVPLRYNELINGVCYLDNPLVRGVFKEEDIELLKLYLSNAALAIENKLLHERLIKNGKEEENIGSSEQAENYVFKAIEYLRKNLSEKLSRDAVAKELDINADYFGKIFKTATGKSFKEYLNEVRVQSTLENLSSSDKKIIDIAYEAGFESLRTFYRIFFRYMGETPSSFREKERRN